MIEMLKKKLEVWCSICRGTEETENIFRDHVRLGVWVGMAPNGV